MKNDNKKEIDRRNFLKYAGTGSIAATAALYGCNQENNITKNDNYIIGEVPTDKMTYRINHNTGDKVSLLGYGCMRWPLRKNAKGEDEIDQDAVNELVDYAIAHGVNYFDTAPVYVRGWSETATGIALKRHPREKFFIATKMSNQRDTPLLRTFEGSKNLYEKSMRDLQVDYIDYYLLHYIGMGGMKTLRERFYDNGLLDFLMKEREAGRIRNLGWSFHGDIECFNFLLSQMDDGKVHWDFAMIQLNYVDWMYASGRNTNAKYLLGELEKRNIPTAVMEPILGGRLSHLRSEPLQILQQLRPEASAASWAFRYAATPKNIFTVLSGMVYLEHLQENIQTYSPLVPINEQEYDALEKVTEILVDDNYIQCNECQYCMPCPYGVDIPSVFGHYNKIVSEGKRLRSSDDKNYQAARRAFLIGYDQSIPKLRQANHCTGCATCVATCPQNMDIPKEMQRVDVYAELLKQKTSF